MNHGFVVHKPGGLEALTWQEVPLSALKPGQALVKHTAIGLNFIDTYHRTGFYPAPLPTGIGVEAVGVVEDIAEGGPEIPIGTRVAYACPPPGAYVERRVMDAYRLVPIPDDICDEDAAAIFLKGLTVQYLIKQTYKVNPGDTILVHSAAGGVGSLLCQWASHLGAKVLGTVSTDEKATYASALGCHHPIVTTKEDFHQRVLALTKGRKLPVVYDSVGADTFERSLQCLAPRGLMVSYGQSSGAAPLLEVGLLSRLGSLYLTRPTLFSYAASRAQLLEMAEDLFEALRLGALKVQLGQRFALKDAPAAQAALEARATKGATVLFP